MVKRHQPALQRLSKVVAPRSVERFLKGIDRQEDLDDLLAAVLSQGMQKLQPEQIFSIFTTLKTLPPKRKRLVLCLLLSPRRVASISDLRTDLYGQDCNDNSRFNKLFADTKDQLGELRYECFPGTCLFQICMVPRRNKRYRRLEAHPFVKFVFLESTSTVYSAKQSWKLARRPPQEAPESTESSTKSEPDSLAKDQKLSVPAEVHLRLLQMYQASQEEVRSLRLRLRLHERERELAGLPALEPKAEPSRVPIRNLPA